MYYQHAVLSFIYHRLAIPWEGNLRFLIAIGHLELIFHVIQPIAFRRCKFLHIVFSLREPERCIHCPAVLIHSEHAYQRIGFYSRLFRICHIEAALCVYAEFHFFVLCG